MEDQLDQQWRDWAQSRQLGSPAQIEAAVQAAITAVRGGATSDQAAASARASALSAASPPPGALAPHTRAQQEFAPGGITWEAAMEQAAHLMKLLPREGNMKLNRENTVAEFNLSLAQGWISFARELTMRSRSVR